MGLLQKSLGVILAGAGTGVQVSGALEKIDTPEKIITVKDPIE